MSLLDRVKAWVGTEPAAPVPAAPAGPPPDADGLREALRVVLDPEIGVDVVSMGLIREIEVVEGHARIDMTLSTAGCPVGPLIVGEVEEVVRSAGLIPQVVVGFDPPWTPDDMDPIARASLGRRR